MKKNLTLVTVILLSFTLTAFGQSDNIKAVQSWLKKNSELADKDYEELVITGHYTSPETEIEHLYLAQAHNGIRVQGTGITAALKNGELSYVSYNIISNLTDKIGGAQNVDFQSAYHSVLDGQISGLQVLDLMEEDLLGRKFVQLLGDDYSHKSRTELVYFKTPENGIRLAWSFDAELPGKEHWYNYFIDAESGLLLEKYDWVVSCTHNHNHSAFACSEFTESNYTNSELTTIFDGSSYRVFELPIESPIHGERTVITEPADPTVSPFGWHDTNGEEGPEYTITRGNNVFAYEDENDANFGAAASGGDELTFDFPYNPNNLPEDYQDAAITNLFYTNNRIHDIMYYYGFDEVSGNFQEFNYSGQGANGDHVNAEAQDGGGLNNANFATPPDGQNPRMQMYLWNTGGQSTEIFTVNAPETLAGSYTSSDYSDFGPTPDGDGVTADLVIYDDGADSEACNPANNPEEIEGKIALTYRGGCNFTNKVENAQAAGAVACIVINNQPGLLTMGGFAPGIEIPSLMITESDGQVLVDAINNGETINASLSGNDGANINDGSFDNGIIVHEYAHGISNRLTGGPNISNGLFNDEQMGEGWSDYYAILLTMNIDIDDPVYRPMGVFASGEPVDGIGIRPAPYDTSLAVNDFTYGDVENENSISQPHGIGFIWCSMLWDMTWLLIDEYGYDPDLINGEGGNIISMKLVTEALKLQPTSPGFVDGRDAILAADQVLYDGEHECLIWEAFARRGLGFSASQGSSANRFDGQEAFDLPPICQTVITAPTALFSASTELTCTGQVQFTDQSVDVPQSWFWEFGDGNTSEEQNPSHTYEEPGTYTVSLTVTNTLGEDTQVLENYIEFGFPDSPLAEDVQGCTGELITLAASAAAGTVEWRDNEGDEIGVGDEIQVELGETSTTFFAYAVQNSFDPAFIGPVNESFENGGNHATNFTGTVDFTTTEEVIIVSSYVVSGGPGERTIYLWDDLSGTEGSGDIIQEITVDIDFTGPGTIDLGFEIPGPGSYSIGLNQANLYRNEGIINYPFEIDDLMTIVGSSAGQTYYYYFYNIQIDKPSCESEPTEVQADVLGSAQFESEVNDLTVDFTDVSGSSGPWSWDFGDGSTSTEQNPIHTYASQGTYTVSLTTESGCVSAEDINVGTVGVEDIENTEIVILPNPADNLIRIIDNDPAYALGSVQVFDLSGRLVENQLIQNKETILDVSGLSSGTYIVTLSDMNNAPIIRHQLIVSH